MNLALQVLGTVEYPCNSSTGETETGQSQVYGQPGLYNEFKASLAT
jgi:hypothetical protein